MRKTSYALWIIIMLLAAGCGGQVALLTATPLPTTTPNLIATQAQQALLDGQTAAAATVSALETAQAAFAATADANAALQLTAQVAMNTDREALSIAQTEVAQDTGVLQQSFEAVASEQALLSADRDAFQLTQAAADAAWVAAEATRMTQQMSLADQQAALADQQATLATQQMMFATAQAAQTDERDTLDSERAALDSERGVLDNAQATLEAGQGALSTAQAAFEAGQAALEENQALLATQQAALVTQQAALAEQRATLAAQQTTFATVQAAQNDERGTLDSERAALDNERSVLDNAQVTLEAEQVALSTAQAELEVGQTTLEENQAMLVDQQAALATAQAALAAEQAALATAQADASPETVPFIQPTTPPTRVAGQPAQQDSVWQQIMLEDLGITLTIPPDFEPQPAGAADAIFQRDDGLTWPAIIQIQQATLADLLGDNPPPGLIVDDPVAVLEAGMQAVTADGFMELRAPAVPFPDLAFPAAQARAALPDSESPMVFVLLQTGADNWLLLLITGQEADLAIWVDPISRSVTPLDSVPQATEQAAIPQLTPTPTPAETAAMSVEDAAQAIGMQFILPEGWTFEALEASEFTYPTIELTDPDSEHSIGIIRFTTEEFSTSVAEIPAGQDAVETLTQMAQVIPNDLGVAPATPRVNEVVIGPFTGAWTQLQGEEEVNRLYLFTLGEDEWLLIGAFGPRETFNTFNRTELRDFLNSLAPLEDQGVALGLDFALPEGWQMTGPTGPPETEPAHITLKPAQPDDQQREIIIARGEAARFGPVNLPADAPDAQAALLPVAEAIRDESGNLGTRLRAEPIQIGMFSGATASLRGEEEAVRLYLFDLAGDDWLLIIAHATTDAFNAFSRAELRDFLNSLRLASAEETAGQIEPISPIEEVTVARISDGDTIYVYLNGVEESVRIIGVDTPEAHSPTAGADWLGYTATHFISQYISPGSTVYLESDIRDRDDYQRLLRYVWIKDEAGDWLMLEAELIRAGLAHVRTYDEERYVPYFHALEREAQAARRGLWGDRPPAPPSAPLARVNDTVWVANPDGTVVPLLYDAAALGNVPDPVAAWPNNLPAVVRDVYYVYPSDIDPATGEPVSREKVGYWYWLEINDFRGWVPEGWLLLEAPENPAAQPDTDIIAYAEPFVVSETDLEVRSVPGGGDVVGTFAPESRVQVKRLGYDPAAGEWWLYADTQTIDGWVPLANLNRLSPENR